MWSKRTIATAAVAGLAVVGTAGVAAATGSAVTTASGLPDGLESLVEDGTLTQEEADAAEKARDALREQFQEQREARQAERQANLDELAGIIGISSDELVQRYTDGESLEQIAGDKADEVEAWLTQREQDRLAELEASIPDRVADQMQRTAGEGRGFGLLGGPGGRGGHGMGMGPGMGWDADAAPSDDADTTSSGTAGSA